MQFCSEPRSLNCFTDYNLLLSTNGAGFLGTLDIQWFASVRSVLVLLVCLCSLYQDVYFTVVVYHPLSKCMLRRPHNLSLRCCRCKERKTTLIYLLTTSFAFLDLADITFANMRRTSWSWFSQLSLPWGVHPCGFRKTTLWFCIPPDRCCTHVHACLGTLHALVSFVGLPLRRTP
jgi:hypothetical protein